MSPQRTGRALVISNAGPSYVADVTIEGNVVHGRRVRQRCGGNGDYWYRSVNDRAWSFSALREVRWETA